MSSDDGGGAGPYTIRQCGPGDIAGVEGLSRRWGAEGSTVGQEPISAETLRSWLGGNFWVAERDSVVVGFAYASVHDDRLAVIPPGERYVKLEELYVVPEHRSRGVGSRLVDRVLAEAAAHGIMRAWVYSSAKEWRRVADFYERHGFKMWFVGLYR